MTILAKSFAFEGLNFTDHHMALDGFVNFVVAGVGFPKGANCAIVAGRETTALVRGVNCAELGGLENTVTITDPSTCADT